jgi:predicted glutamine amidotransferase
MCIATKGIIPHAAMSGFKKLARKARSPPGQKSMPRSGWGVAYYPGGRLRAVREFGDACTSVRYDEVAHMASSNPDARVLLGQLWASPSKEILERHDKLAPFSGQDASGKEWLFAFDGMAMNDRTTGEPFMPDPVKQMCSERVFSALLQNLHGGPADHDKVRDAIKAALDGVAAAFEYDHLNLALTDGTAVYLARFVDKEADYNEIWYSKLPRAIVGCSEALQSVEQNWERLENRRLLVFDPSQNLLKLEL